MAGLSVVTNSTFSGNSATLGGGAIYSGDANIWNSTFAGNSAGQWGAIYSDRPSLMANSIVSGTAGQCGGLVFVGGGSRVTDDSCPGTVVTAAQLALGPLAPNGGPTQTIALGPTSVALEVGDDAICANPLRANGLDQRGVVRPQGAHCDSGAFERVVFNPNPAVAGFSPLSGKVGSTVTITGSNLGSVNGVTFNGVPAKYSVRSPSTLVATVPAGATTGPIRVTTSYLTSAQSIGKFFVHP